MTSRQAKRVPFRKALTSKASEDCRRSGEIGGGLQGRGGGGQGRGEIGGADREEIGRRSSEGRAGEVGGGVWRLRLERVEHELAHAHEAVEDERGDEAAGHLRGRSGEVRGRSAGDRGVVARPPGTAIHSRRGTRPSGAIST